MGQISSVVVTMKLSFPLLFLIFTILVVNVGIATSPSVPGTVSTPDVEDVTLYDVWQGKANESTPGYYGEIQLFYGQKLFYVQHGGVHNWALIHIVFNETVYITKITNCEFINNQIIVHKNETWIELSNNTSFWKPCLECPLCNATMHACEFSHNSLALYYFCDPCRLVIGEMLGGE